MTLKITEILQVLSDSTRLRMLRLLKEEELSVAELQEVLDMGQSRISSHLSLLRRYNMVSIRKEGKKTFYTLAIDQSKQFELVRLALSTDSNEEFWETDMSALQRIADRRRRASEGEDREWRDGGRGPRGTNPRRRSSTGGVWPRKTR